MTHSAAPSSATPVRVQFAWTAVGEITHRVLCIRKKSLSPDEILEEKTIGRRAAIGLLGGAVAGAAAGATVLGSNADPAGRGR